VGAAALALALTFGAGASAAAQSKTDISGAWVFSIQGDATVTAQITFKVEEGRLSGHVSSPMSGEQDFIGTVDGSKFEFGFGGDAGQIVFTGSAESNAALKGTFENPGAGSSGTFTAKRKE
jgi:hypothetical protein